VTDVLEIAKFQGISQSEIARRLDVHQSSVSRALGGVPAVGPERILKKEICSMLSIDEEFLSEKSNYPFLPTSFVRFRIRGLKARRHPLAWLELLNNYSEELKVLLFLQENLKRVEVACVKDNKDSIFFVFIEIPVSREKFFDYVGKGRQNKVFVVVNEFFDSTTVGLYRSADDIADYDYGTLDSLIKEAFSYILTDTERRLIQVVRENKVSIEKVIEYIERKEKY